MVRYCASSHAPSNGLTETICAILRRYCTVQVDSVVLALSDHYPQDGNIRYAPMSNGSMREFKSGAPEVWREQQMHKYTDR